MRSQAPPATVGRIEGEDIAVKGAVSVEVENGRSTTLLASGSEVTVRSGQARLVLVDGGEIGVCAPAHFSLLKSGVSIADGPRDATVGLEATGAMCVLAASGVVRVEQQLSGQSLLVPQTGEVAFAGGQLESLRGATGTCHCDVLAARAAPPPPPRPPEISVPVSPGLARPIKPPVMPGKTPVPENREEPNPPKIEEPIYKVIMPPLTFDAAAPAPPPVPGPDTILLVREVRVRPAEVFHGRVEGASAPTASSPTVRAAVPEDAPKSPLGVFAKLRRFFRRVFSREPCAGAGCGGQAK